MIKIDFSFETPHGKFADALHLPDDHDLTDEQIEAMKIERRDNWIAVVTAPSPEAPQDQPPENLTTVNIGDEEYTKLEGTPPSGAKLIEINGIWYYKA
jgi:hypothetical protein